MCWLEKRRAADAYDSGKTGGGCRNIGQLILMTLAAKAVIGETLGCGSWLMPMFLAEQAAVGETQGANAHDAGRTGSGWRNDGQLMPMMLRWAANAHDAGRTGGGRRNAGQLMPMMLAAQAVVGETMGS